MDSSSLLVKLICCVVLGFVLLSELILQLLVRKLERPKPPLCITIFDTI